MNTTNELAERVTVDHMVAVYQDACKKIDEGYRLLNEAQAELVECMGAHHSDFDTIDYYAKHDGKVAAEQIKLKVKRSVWKMLIDKLGIRKILSVKRAEELDKKFYGDGDRYKIVDQFPELTTDSVFQTINDLMGSADDFAKEAVAEVYEFLRPAAADSWNKKYVTNDRNGKFELGKKVILAWRVEGSFGNCPFRVIYSHHKEFYALDRVFHLLDGKGIPEGYNSPLIDAINTSPDGFGETEYFKFRACQNRNLHLEFKRMDLVTELNRIASDQTQLKDGKKGRR